MSVHQVLGTTRDMLADDAAGLAAKVATLVAALRATPFQPSSSILTNFNFTKWALRGSMNPASAPNVMLRPARWLAVQKLANKPDRDGDVAIEIGYEIFGGDPDVIQDNVSIVATALAECLDGLRAYSDAHQGTVIQVLDPIEWRFGEFAGPTSAGFLALVTVQERSAL